jgi:hypothetical protein
MKMALQIGGTTVIDNSRNLVNIAGGTVPNATNATNATNLTGTGTGSINSSALATGTANSSTFLRGDRTWGTVSATPTTADVLNATAGASVGAVGTYAMLIRASGEGTIGAGSTIAGSSMRYMGSVQARDHTPYGDGFLIQTTFGGANAGNGGTPAGTWRCMGYAPFVNTTFGENQVKRTSPSLFLRIS